MQESVSEMILRGFSVFIFVLRACSISSFGMPSIYADSIRKSISAGKESKRQKAKGKNQKCGALFI
jgi:hypothetical protein